MPATEPTHSRTVFHINVSLPKSDPKESEAQEQSDSSSTDDEDVEVDGDLIEDTAASLRHISQELIYKKSTLS